MITRILFVFLFLVVITEIFYHNSVLFSQQTADTVKTSVQTVDKNKSSTIGPKSIITQGSKIWEFTISKVFWSIIVFIVALILMKYTTRLLETLAERWPRFRLTIKSIIPIIRIFGWTTVLYIIIAGIFAPPIETIIAVTAMAGIIGISRITIVKPTLLSFFIRKALSIAIFTISIVTWRVASL